MVYQPAAGARDLLPLDVAQKRWIEDRLEQVFQGWGYHRIITSTLERMDTLMAGEAIVRQMVIQLQNIQNEELGLRPELTASIARAVVTRMTDTVMDSTRPLVHLLEHKTSNQLSSQMSSWSLVLTQLLPTLYLTLG